MRFAPLLVLCLAVGAANAVEPKMPPAKSTRPVEGLIVDPDGVTQTSVRAWKNDGFKLIVLTLNERFEAAVFKNAAKIVAAESLDLYYWIEVARNPAMAREHPEWMASLGTHDDWRARFPDAPKLKDGDVAKAWPWTPIVYRGAFDAHLTRVAELLKRVPPNYRGLLLNDLQGGPSSCGCGNIQCRWAIDYYVPSTTSKIEGADVAGKFLTEVRQVAAGKEVIPVWTTECEEHDLALEKQPPGGWSTGFCGRVECFNHQCPMKFAEQWRALHITHHGPTGVLLLHKEFQRDRKEYGGAANWIVETVENLDHQQPNATPRNELWLVVQGYGASPDEAAAARQVALHMEPGAVLVARARIDQSYEPSVLHAKPK